MEAAVSEFQDAVNTAYQKALAGFGSEGAQLADVIGEALPHLRMMVANNALRLDIDEIITTALRDADTRNGKQADRVLAQLAAGGDSLDFDGDPMLDVGVTLGKGLRKRWRDITADDLELMDVLRYENVRKQQDAYTSWRVVYSPVAHILKRYATVGDAYADGAFMAERAA